MGRRPLLTWLAAIATLLLTLTLSGSALLPPRTLTVLQLNLCNSGISGCFTHRSVQRAAELIRAYAPDVVALNEICSGDVNELARVFPKGTAATGFQSAPDRRTRTGTLCVNGQQFGMGIILRTAGSAGGDSIVDGGIYTAQDLNDPEIRAWLCVSAERTACTGHLASTSVPIAQQQCRELIRTARTRHAILAGDLNLREEQVRPCVPRDFLWTGDRDVQYVGASSWARLVTQQVVDMAGSTDHPALLVVLGGFPQRK